MDVVCYHYPCIDGIFSALAAHLHYKAETKAVRFFPLSVFKPHTADDLCLTGSETVYMCDFSGPPGFAVNAARLAARVVVLDHHKTAEEVFQRTNLPANLELHLDMSRSGATIAADFFKPSLSPNLELAFRYVEDADLWAWKLQDSRAFHAGIGAMHLEFDVNTNPGIFDLLQALDVAEVVAAGRIEIQSQERFIASALTQAYRVELGGQLGRERGWGVALAVRIDDAMSRHRSKLGNDLASLAQQQGLQPIGVVAYREKDMPEDDTIKLSLRGIGDATDTTPVSEAFNGGGHRLASSCTVKLVDFNDWKFRN